MNERMIYKIPSNIGTKRLYLRKPQENDWKDLYAYYSDAECMRFTAGRALTDWEVWRKVAMLLGHWEIRGFGPYVIELAGSDKVIGVVGMWYPLEWPEPEIKWGLTREYWHKGYAKEAAEAVRVMAVNYLPEYNLISLISQDNLHSIKLAESLGAVYERTIPFRDSTALLYRHKR